MVWNNITIYRCPVWVPKIPTGAKRIFHLFSFVAGSWPLLMLRGAYCRPGVIWTVEPAFFGVPGAWLAAKLSGAKLWLHVQDFEIDAAFGLGLVRGNCIRVALSRFESWLMSHCQVVSSISQAMVERLLMRGVGQGEALLFPNWVDRGQVRPLPAERSLRNEWTISPNRKVVLYSGNMGQKQGLELVLEVAEEFKGNSPEFLFLMVGKGASREWLQSEANRRGLSNVVFKPLQPVERLSALLATADIHLVLQRRGVADLAMPSKLAGILAAGGASIVTADPGTELYRTVLDNSIGYVIPPESSANLSQALRKLAGDPGLMNGIRKNALRYAGDHLDREKIMGLVEKKLVSLAVNDGKRNRSN